MGRIELHAAHFSLRDCRAQRTFLPVAHRKSLSLRSSVDEEVPDGVVGDPTRVRQVVLNLIGNAPHSKAGAGLAISAKLGGLMGGDIRVESRPGEGCTFHFTVHFGLTPQRTMAPTSRAWEAPQRLGAKYRRFANQSPAVLLSLHHQNRESSRLRSHSSALTSGWRYTLHFRGG